MTTQQAQNQAARLGMSAWIAEAIAISRDGSAIVELRCIGFASADVPIAEAETWEEALHEATRIVFSA